MLRPAALTDDVQAASLSDVARAPPLRRIDYSRRRAAKPSSAREYARIKIDGLRLVGGNPDFTNAPGHGDDGGCWRDRSIFVERGVRGDARSSVCARPSRALPRAFYYKYRTVSTARIRRALRIGARLAIAPGRASRGARAARGRACRSAAPAPDGGRVR